MNALSYVSLILIWGLYHFSKGATSKEEYGVSWQRCEMSFLSAMMFLLGTLANKGAGHPPTVLFMFWLALWLWAEAGHNAGIGFYKYIRNWGKGVVQK